MDPGAVPGGSTIFCKDCAICTKSVRLRAAANAAFFAKESGAETGSTRVVKVCGDVRHCIRRYRANIINANDNVAFVAANDNVVVAGDVRKAA